MTLKHLLAFSLLLWAVTAHPQWEGPILLTRDNEHDYGAPSFVVDDAFLLHVMYVKVSYDTSPQTSSLYYQRFDHNGNPRSAPMEVLPDSHWLDYPATIFLDRRQTIHFFWSRTYLTQGRPHLFYARMNLEGNFLTFPTIVEADDQDHYWTQGGGNFVQDSTGLIWLNTGTRFTNVSEDGEVLGLLVRLGTIEPLDLREGAKFALSPDNHVWAFVRHLFNEPPYQNLGVMRMDTAGWPFEIVSDNHGGGIIQMSPEGFHIDRMGAFHYVLYRDDMGLVYQRDARDGSPPDTIVFDDSPYGFGTTPLIPCGDTLQFLWGQSEPTQGFLRVGFSLSGGREFGPLFVPMIYFSLTSGQDFVWKQGSYWLVGPGGDASMATLQVVLMHISGPHEPLSARSPQRDTRPFSTASIRAFPQPSQSVLHLNLADFRMHPTVITLFDILGRRVGVLSSKHNGNGVVSVNLPEYLPAGTYFLEIRGNTARYIVAIQHQP